VALEALAREYQSAASVPLSYDEFTYGVLTVYADRPDAFDDMIRAVLAELGETIASAIAAVERKRALVSDENTRLEFEVADETFVFARLARLADCVLSSDGVVRQHERGASVVATVDGAPPAAVATAAAELVGVERAQVIHTDEYGGGDGDSEPTADADTSDAETTDSETIDSEPSTPMMASAVASSCISPVRCSRIGSRITGRCYGASKRPLRAPGS